MGVFVAWPALVIIRTAEKQPGLGLGDYLRCRLVAEDGCYSALIYEQPSRLDMISCDPGSVSSSVAF
jgi:hypothetical protein